MPLVQLQCPQCIGLFQTDSALAGQVVACPLCGSGVQLPPLELLAPQFASGPPPPPVPPGSTAPVPLACPLCGNGFMVPPEYVGREVACPHCQQVVSTGGPAQPTWPTTPPPGPPGAGFAPTPEPEPFAISTRGGSKSGKNVSLNDMFAPTDPTPVPQPIFAPVRAVSSPANLYPPTIAPSPPPTSPSTPVRAVNAPPPESLYPPGMSPPTSAPSPSPTPAKPYKKKVDDLLPPGATSVALPTPPVAPAPATFQPVAPIPAPATLPPTTTPVKPKKPSPETLLPAGRSEAVAPTEALAQVALPQAEMAQQLKEMQRPKPPSHVPEGTILLPTDDGYVALREPVKTAGKGYDERELLVLPPELKRKRRRWRNFVVYTVGLVLLVIIFAALMQI